jgi:3'(2'), 5'-bisphosphate nucleotidase
MDDAKLAERLATEAGKLLLEVREKHADAEPRALGKIGDETSHAFIARELGRERPEDVFFSEEAKAPEARLTAERVWIVDPLDGTREFSERREDWGVHVALVRRGQPLIGAVALPGKGRTLTSYAPPAVPPHASNKLRILVSRTRPPEIAQRVAERVGAELVPMGSAGAKACAVVTGDFDAYLHAGGMYEWDTCAPVAVALAAGFHVSRIDGTPLVYNQQNPWTPDLLVCHPELAQRLLEAIAQG